MVIVGGTGGLKVTMAVADFVGSAKLVAVTVTVCEVLIDPGAVYSPAVLMAPVFVNGLILQLTAVLLVPVTVLVNCCCCNANKVIAAGPTVTETGAKDIMAVADFVGSRVLVAVRVTVWAAAIELGAVYIPAGVILPVFTFGERLQVTVLLLRPDTDTLNCCVCPAESVVTGGVTPMDT